MEALLLATLAKTGGAPIEVTFDEDAHRYTTANGVIIPSVTTLMKPLTEKAYRSIDREVLRVAAELGTAVHECTEFFDCGDLDEDSVLPEWTPYLEAYQKFLADYKSEHIAVEQKLACESWSGTIDRVSTIGNDLWIIDLKTTSSIHAFAGIQLAGYALLWHIHHPEETRKINRAVLQLRDDGTYKFKAFTSDDDFTCFLSLLSINKWETNHV